MKVLDCTLRDGGYVNNWEFSTKQITTVINSLKKSNVDIIEYGYLNDTKGKAQNSTIFDSISAIDGLIEGGDHTQKVVMINLGDYNIKNLPPKDQAKIDGIRLAFHKDKLEEALQLSIDIMKLGYKLYFQPMVTKNYKDIEFLSMVEQVNKLSPYAFYIVDSFGSMTLNEFNRYLVLADNNLNNDIALGYHSHNNMQLAFSNAINMCSTKFKRDIIIDSSIYGIGRGAGNLNTELITDYLNNSLGTNYNTLPLLEIIDEFLNSLMKKTPWGFSPAQYLSASFNCHPNYATFLINKNTNHIVGVRKVLEKLPDSKKSSFDKEYIEKLYIDSLLEVKTKVEGRFEIPKYKKILLIASGKSVNEHKEILNQKSESKEYTIIALNHYPDIECDYYFFANQKRYDEFNGLIPDDKLVITSNIATLNSEVLSVLDFKKFAFIENEFFSNVAMVALNYCLELNVKEVEIAGLDGYRVDSDNYNYSETSVIVDNNELIIQNQTIKRALEMLKKHIKINFLTPSIFE